MWQRQVRIAARHQHGDTSTLGFTAKWRVSPSYRASFTNNYDTHLEDSQDLDRAPCVV